MSLDFLTCNYYKIIVSILNSTKVISGHIHDQLTFKKSKKIRVETFDERIVDLYHKRKNMLNLTYKYVL